MWGKIKIGAIILGFVILIAVLGEPGPDVTADKVGNAGGDILWGIGRIVSFLFNLV